ncbi:hypothetical protein AAKU55_005531 [Oxalobacteraceae bacterium GrIS 1.11]
MAAESTTRDALIAEMLGDIGKLNDRVESLKGVLPGQIEVFEAKITGLIGHLSKAGDDYRKALSTYFDNLSEVAQIHVGKEAQAAKERFDRDSSAAIRAALTEVERTVKSTVQTEIAAPVQKVLRSQQQSIWRTLALCLACGMVGGGVVLGANLFTYDKREAGFTELGKVVAASWDKLDNKARTTINAERGK